MRIGVDGASLANRRGFGRFARNLVTEMAHRSSHPLVLLLDEPSLGDAPVPNNVEVVGVRVAQSPSRAASATSYRTLRDIGRMSMAAHRAACDVFFFPTTYTYYPVPGTPVVVTVHDATAERMPGLVFPDWRAHARWALKQQASIRWADAVVTVSRSAREEVARLLPVRENRLHVVSEAPDPVFRPIPIVDRGPVLARFGLGPGDRYLLYVGGISPHKNLETLVTAFEAVTSCRPNVRLLLVGDLTDDPFLSCVGPLRERVSTSPVGNRITLTGYVEDAALAVLYTSAVATILPSRAEGFGLPAAESSACGTPVVASDIPALRELLGDAALYASPSDPGAFAAALGKLLDDPDHRARLSSACLARAMSWSWDAQADAVLRLLEHVWRRSRRGRLDVAERRRVRPHG